MDIGDSDIRKHTVNYRKPKPQAFDFLIEGMRRIIFGSDGLFKKIKLAEKPKKIKFEEDKKKRKLFHKFKVINIKPIFHKQEPSFFITNFDKLKLKNHLEINLNNNSDSTRQSTHRKNLPSLQLENNFEDEKINFLKKFSRNSLSSKCSEIYKDNINLLRQFSLENLSNNTTRYQDIKRREYDSDRKIFGDIDKRFDVPASIRNKSTGMVEYFDKKKVNLIKFGENVNKMHDDMVVGYRDYLENTYTEFAKKAHVNDELVTLVKNKSHKKLSFNNHTLQRLNLKIKTKGKSIVNNN
jgi:hypothetical protein